MEQSSILVLLESIWFVLRKEICYNARSHERKQTENLFVDQVNLFMHMFCVLVRPRNVFFFCVWI